MSKVNAHLPVAAVIGGGACGLSAAIALCRRLQAAGEDAQVVVVEKLPRVGKKILATGNGRCNLTNMYADKRGFYGDAAFAHQVLSRNPVESTLQFFRDLGLLCKEETQGRIYPDCEQAASVLEVLRLECERLGVVMMTDSPVSGIESRGGGFLLTLPHTTLYADTVLLCCGGKAAPALGADGSGYALAQSLGHTVVTPFPALVQLKSKSKYPRQLKGVRKKCYLHMEIDGQAREGAHGEVLFTEYGLSGIVVMEQSRYVSEALADGREHKVLAVLNLMPRQSKAELLEWLEHRQRLAPGLAAQHLLTGLVHSRLGQILMKQSGIALDMPAGEINPAGLERIATLLGHWTLIIDGTTGFAGAQVTAGGVNTAEIDPRTLESLCCPHVYFGGELVNVDGACGGYNLQWAWSTGLLAAESMAVNMIGKTEDGHASNQ